MRKIAFAALASVAFVGAANAGASWNDNAACMRDGPTSQACEWARSQDERANEQQREFMERSREAQCRASHLPYCY